ncbi:MAG: hypothetical protein PVH52_05705 [bacterium]|jgi:hypothetical protein
MKNRRLVMSLGILQAFIGLGAVAGGLGLTLDPSGASVGLPIEMLRTSPFTTFLIPGIVLFTVNGLGSLVGAVLTFKRHRYAGWMAMALGAFLVAWIVIQVYWVRGIHWLHGLYFVLGTVEFAMGRSLRRL